MINGRDLAEVSAIGTQWTTAAAWRGALAELLSVPARKWIKHEVPIDCPGCPSWHQPGLSRCQKSGRPLKHGATLRHFLFVFAAVVLRQLGLELNTEPGHASPSDHAKSRRT